MNSKAAVADQLHVRAFRVRLVKGNVTTTVLFVLQWMMRVAALNGKNPTGHYFRYVGGMLGR